MKKLHGNHCFRIKQHDPVVSQSPNDWKPQNIIVSSHSLGDNAIYHAN